MIHVIFFCVVGVGFVLIVGLLVLNVLVILFLDLKTLCQSQQVFSGQAGKPLHVLHPFYDLIFGALRSRETHVSWHLLPIFKLIPLHDDPNVFIRPKIIPNRFRFGVVGINCGFTGLDFAISVHDLHRWHWHKLEMLPTFDQANAGKWRDIKFARWLRHDFLNTAGSILLQSRSRDQTWQPPFRVNLASVPPCAHSVALKFAPPPSHTSGLLTFLFRWPEDWLAPGPPAHRNAPRLHPARLPLHSGSQVSSLRRIRWCDQNGVEFSAKSAPNPSPFSSQNGWCTHRVPVCRC